MHDVIVVLGAIALLIFMAYNSYIRKQRRKKVKKTCPYCKNEISLDATVCPYCRRKQGYNLGAEIRGGWAESGCLTRIILIAAGIAALILLLMNYGIIK